MILNVSITKYAVIVKLIEEEVMRILYVGYRDSRHSKFGGYDYISRKPDSIYLDSATLPFGFIPVGKRGKKLNIIFLDIVARIKSNKFDIVHYFYADFMLFKKVPKTQNTKFVATIHMRSEGFSESKIKILKSFAGVIVLSSAEEKKLKKLGVNSFFVPHGFNKPDFVFVDNKIDKSKLNIFYAGMNYRDFETFYKIAIYFYDKRPDIHFYAVGQSKERKEMIGKLKNITVCPRLNDDEYYSLLCECDYNFLPLTFATANNALLEAQNLGIISILPKIDGIEDYADSENNLYYREFDDIKIIFYRLKKSGKNTTLIDFSKKFMWENIYEQLDEIYCNCGEKNE